MKKLLSIVALSVLCSFTMSDCSFYFTMKEGDVMETQTFDSKDKLTGSSKQTVTAKKENAITFKSVSYDKKGKDAGTVLYDIICENNNLKIDMKSFMNPEFTGSYDPSTLSITCDYLELPSNLSVGQTLADGFLSVKTKGEMPMPVMEVKITNRKVEAKEDKTSPAGTFNCYKITYDVESKISFIKVSGKAAEWYSPEKGMIRSENYDKKGALTGYTVRTK